MIRDNIASSDKDGALAGVSALIVFIALVLVAAIAASVILNTAGFLQERAQTTGQSSSNQISTTLNTISIVGEIQGIDTGGTVDGNQVYTQASDVDNADEYKITEIRITVLSAPGSPEIDLEDSTVQITQPKGDGVLLPGADGTDGAGNPKYVANSQADTTNQPQFGLESITASTFPLIEDPEDRYRYIIPFDGDIGADASSDPTNPTFALAALGEGERVDIRLVTGPGGSTLERIRTPSTIPNNDGEVVVL